MSGGSQASQLDDKLRRYQALCDVAESIAAHRNLTSLLQDLKDRLQLVARFDAVQVVLHDSGRNLMRRHILESPSPPWGRLSNELPVEESPSGQVWQTQQPMLITDLDASEDRYPQVVATWREHGVKTVYILPLTSLNRRLGALGFISGQEAAWGEDEQEFLRQVAKLVAVAVDNIINFESARAAETELRHRLDQLRLMLQITNAVVSQLDLQELLKVISSSIREAIEIDVVTVSLFDHEIGQLRTIAIDAAPGSLLRGIGFVLPLEGTPGGLAFISGQPVITDQMDLDRFPSEVFRRVYEEGYRSGGSVPLITQGRKLGVLGFASKREYGTSEDDKELMCQIASQIAIAVDNALNFERARLAEKEIRHQFERERLMLEINNAVVSKLDLRELVQVVSSCLRQALQLDITSVALYNAETNELRAYLFDLPDILPPIEEGTPIPLEGTIGGVSLMSGHPIFINRTDGNQAAADFDRRLIEAGIRSGGCVPLVARDRKLGILAVGSFREDAFPETDQELLIHIANQIAIAVDNSLNFERARAAEQEAKRQSDRLSLVLRTNNAVVSQLDLRELLPVIFNSLRQVLPHDTASIALYDPESNRLRVFATDFPEQMQLVEERYLVPLEGSVMGLAFTSGEPVFLDEFDLERFPSDFTLRSYEAGLRSCGNIPLISHGRKLGALGVASRQTSAFSAEDIELFCQSASQIAIAVENALNFERACAAEQEVTRQFERQRLMLEINNAVVSHLSIPELLQAISACLRRVIPHDFAALTLYDPDSRMLRPQSLGFMAPQGHPPQNIPLPLEGTSPGLAVLSRKTVLRHHLDLTEFPAEAMKRAIQEGVASGCSVPLISHDRVLGTLDVASRREAAFTEADAELLTQIGQQIAIAVENALSYREIEALKNKLASEKLYLEDEIRTEHNFEELIGESRIFKRLLKQVETVAPTDSAVLIRGETGTGKELLARAIHDLSERRTRTLVKLNCAAIPTGLLESELFGHEKGAFTGAISQRIGRFELANHGTLFLDEVGDIPLELQPKLLRVLQEQEFERLGSTRTQKVHVRLIAATNCDLEQMVADKKYRSDLYYRLNVFPITIPPLRERREDIPALTRFFTQKYARRMKKQVTAIPAETLEALTNYAWPGNVRELEHFIERAVILTRGPDLRVLPSELKATEVAPATPIATLQDAEREHIRRALEEANWVIGGPGGAAARLGMKRSTLQSRMQKLGIRRHN